MEIELELDRIPRTPPSRSEDDRTPIVPKLLSGTTRSRGHPCEDSVPHTVFALPTKVGWPKAAKWSDHWACTEALGFGPFAGGAWRRSCRRDCCNRGVL